MTFPEHPFPKHLTLSLRHNDHKSSYMTVAEYCETVQNDLENWVSEEQRLKAIETNELWELQWYPDTPVGFCIKLAADLDVLLEWSRRYSLEEAAMRSRENSGDEAEAPTGLTVITLQPESPRSGK